MTTENTTHILTRLAVGFRTDSAKLKELEAGWTSTLHRARSFGAQHGSSVDWIADWHRQWDTIEAILRRIDVLLNEMDRCVEVGGPARTAAVGGIYLFSFSFSVLPGMPHDLHHFQSQHRDRADGEQ